MGTAIALMGCEPMVPEPPPIEPPPIEQPSAPVVEPEPPVRQLQNDPRCPYPVDFRLMDRVAAGAVCVTASNAVPQRQLEELAAITTAMLQHRSDIVATLRERGAVGFLLASEEHPCILWSYWGDRPANECHFDNQGFAIWHAFVCPQWTDAGTLARPICVHEMAHIVDFALDDDEQAPIYARAESPEAKRLWRGTYAAKNNWEFFAVLSGLYFSTGHMWFPEHDYHLIETGEQLRAWDPTSYALVHAVYRGATLTPGVTSAGKA